MSLCRSFFCGRTTREWEVRETSSETPIMIATTDIAIDKSSKNGKKAEYYHLKAIGRTAQLVSQYVAKGTKIVVECEPTQDTWMNKDGKRVVKDYHVIRSWEFAESKNAEKQHDTMDWNPDIDYGVPKDKPKRKAEPKNDERPSFMDIPADFEGEVPFL